MWKILDNQLQTQSKFTLRLQERDNAAQEIVFRCRKSLLTIEPECSSFHLLNIIKMREDERVRLFES